MLRRTLLTILATSGAVTEQAIAQEAPKPGGFGLSIEVDSEGLFLNPTLKTVTVKSVVPGRPAAEAGIKPGDRILKIEGRLIAGTKARELEPLMKKNVGEKLTFRIQRANGEVVAATLIAAAKPN